MASAFQSPIDVVAELVQGIFTGRLWNDQGFLRGLMIAAIVATVTKGVAAGLAHGQILRGGGNDQIQKAAELTYSTLVGFIAARFWETGQALSR